MKMTTTPEGNLNLDYSDHIPQMEQVRRQVADAIARDTDGKVRQALIELGWTPPPEKK